MPESSTNGESSACDVSGGSRELLLVAKKAAVVCVVAGLTVLLFLGIAYAIDVVLIVFAGLLFAIFLCSLSGLLSRYTPLGKKSALGVVVLALFLIVGGASWWLLPTLVAQAGQLRESLPQSLAKLEDNLSQYVWGQWILKRMPETNELLPKPQALLSRTTGVVSTAFGTLGVPLAAFFVGLMLAIQPQLYLAGFLRLVAPAARPRGREVLNRVGVALQWWLIAKIIAMILVGILTWIGLWLLGVDLAATLAVIAAILTFIPNFGPIIAAVPAVMLGLMQSPSTAGWVVVLFVAIQLLESYGITPLIQYRALAMPPALVITAQLILGAWVGLLGLTLATPLTAAAIVIVRMLYVEDVLGDAGTQES